MHERRTLHAIAAAAAVLASLPTVSCGTSSEGPSSGPGGATAGTGGAGVNGGNGAGGASSATGGGSTAGTTSGADADGGSAGGDAGDGRPGYVPASDELADVQSFLAAQAYREAPWVAESPAPRDPSNAASPHGRVRVWMNPALVASINGGHDGMNGNPQADRYSMAVKEIYDETDAQVGLAAMLKRAPGDAGDAWLYFCYGPASQCGITGPDPTVQMPVFAPGSGFGAVSACYYCHSGLVFNKPPAM